MTTESETDSLPPVGAQVAPSSTQTHAARVRQARGVLPHKNDKVIKNPDAQGVFAFVALRPDLDRAGALAWLTKVETLVQELRAARNKAGDRLATVAVGFGPTFFTVGGTPRFTPPVPAPAGFASPPGIGAGAQVAGDVVFYIVSVTEALTARFLQGLAQTQPDVTSITLERGYQRLDGTEPFGYRDGLRNVARNDRTEVVFVDPDRQAEETASWTHNGTYLAYMRIAQNLDAFDALGQDTQDQVIGRAHDGRRLDLPPGSDPHAEPEFAVDIPTTASHVRKAGPRGAVRDSTMIFRRGLPFYEFADGRLHVGLQFASFQASLDQFNVIFNRWMMNPSFPQPAPGRADDLFARGLVTIDKWAFFFVPPDTDWPIGAVMFQDEPGHRKPKTGKFAVRKKVLDANGNESQVDLAGFIFKILDANGQQIGSEFSTDSAGHALSDELPVGQPFTLVELQPAPPMQPASPIAFTLDSARTVIRVTNQVPSGSTYNP